MPSQLLNHQEDLHVQLQHFLLQVSPFVTLTGNNMVVTTFIFRFTDELPSYPESRVRNKRKAVEMQADRDISSLITLLANYKPEKPNNKEVSTQAVISKETADWRNYCKVFADKGVIMFFLLLYREFRISYSYSLVAI